MTEGFIRSAADAMPIVVDAARRPQQIRPQHWFANLLELPGMKLADMSPDVLIASSYLPGKPPNDPSDRIIAATARELGATLLTRDCALLDYGARGHVSVVEC